MSDCPRSSSSRKERDGKTQPRGPRELARVGLLQDGEPEITRRLWEDLGAFHREGTQAEMWVWAGRDTLGVGCDRIAMLVSGAQRQGEFLMQPPSSRRTGAIWKGNKCHPHPPWLGAWST